jgi:lysine/ornithine N-monooxygenase
VSKEIRNFDKHLNFRMIDKLIADQNLTFADPELEETILNYMEVTRRVSDFNESLQIENTWMSYIEFLDYQTWERQRLIDTDCAFAYLDNLGNVYSEGGACYVKR